MRRKERNETRTQQQPASPRAAQAVTAAQAMAAWAPPPECTPLFTLEETGTLASRALGWRFAMPCILLAALAMLAVLVPLAVHFRRDDVRLLQAGDLFDAHRWQESAAVFGSLRPSLQAQPDVGLQWARCLLETDQGEAASACLERIRPRMSTASPRIRRALDADLAALSAWTQIETGHAEAGVAALRDILKKNPQDLTANLALGRYALKAGLMQEATRCYDTLAHNEETAYVLPEFRDATVKVAAAVPAEELAKLPEQTVKTPKPANPTAKPTTATLTGPAKPAAPRPAAAAPTSPTAP